MSDNQEVKSAEETSAADAIQSDAPALSVEDRLELLEAKLETLKVRIESLLLKLDVHGIRIPDVEAKLEQQLTDAE